MKHFLSYILFISWCCVAYAQYPTNGFYRVQNNGTSRYAYVLDNTGSLDYATTDAEMGAIELHRDTARLHYDPASVIYIRLIDNNEHKYNIEAQGTGVYQLIGHYVQTYRLQNGAYWVYASSNGIAKYLGELDNQNNLNQEGSYLATNRQGVYIQWNVYAFGSNGDYFGIRPTVQVGNKHYRPFYASFAIDLQNSGLRAYYINKVYPNAAIFAEITGKIPAYTPVYIECAGPQHWHNRVNIETGAGITAISGNKLKGNFFCNPNRKAYSRDAQVAYNPVTMRMLTSTADGQLCYAKVSELDYLPANESYLEVSASAADTLRIMTEEEYAFYSTPTGIQIAEDSVVVYPGGSTTLHASILPASAQYSNTIAWESSDPRIATIDQTGRCNAVAVGSAYLRARVKGTTIVDSCLIRVRPILSTNIMLSQTYFSAPIGDSLQLTATVFPANATNQTVEWTTTNHGVASVENGLVRIIDYGTDTVFANTTDGTQLRAQCTVFCHAPAATDLSLFAPATIFIGDTFQVTYQVFPEQANATIYRWTESTRGRILSIDAEGRCIANAAGSSTITAYVETTDGFNGTSRFSRTLKVKVLTPPTLASSLDLTADTIQLILGEQQTLAYTLLPTNTTDKTILWTSQDSAIAIATNGVVRGIGEGSTYVYAETTDGSQLRDSCYIVVDNGIVEPDSVFVSTITLSAESDTWFLGDTLQLSATIAPLHASDPRIIWQSSDPTILTIDTTGQGIALSVGTVVVTVTAADGHGATASIVLTVEPILVSQITLSQQEVTCIMGDTIRLEASVSPADATNQALRWSSSDDAILSVDNGICIAHTNGTAVVTVSATDESMISSSCRFNVNRPLADSIAILADEQVVTEIDITIGETALLEVSVLPQEADNSIIWESTDPNVVSIDNGLCTALSVGDAAILCTTIDGSLLTAQCSIHVHPIYVEQIDLNITSIKLYAEDHVILQANVLPADATIATLEWSSSDESVATVAANMTTTANAEGYVVGVAPGEAIITAAATDGSGVVATCTIEVILFSDLETILAQPGQHTIYDIMGRPVSTIDRSGLYVIDGKVVYIIR